MRQAKPGRALALAATLGLAGATQAAEIQVSSAGWDLNMDNEITLLEAAQLLSSAFVGGGGKVCWLNGEKNRVIGANWALVFPGDSSPCTQSPDCGVNPATCVWRLSPLPDYNLGIGHPDTVRVVANIGPVALQSSIGLSTDDQLLGRMPNGERIELQAGALAAGAPAILMSGSNARLEGVTVIGAPGAGVRMIGTNGATVEDSFITGNGGDGIRMEAASSGPAPRSPRDNTIGSNDPARGNFIVGNGNDGILLIADPADSGFNHNNKVFANFIANHGASGIAIFHSRGNRIGDAGLGNEIQGSAGLAGIFIEGENADVNQIFANLIGVTSGSNGNSDGIFIFGGADDSLIGGSGALANRILRNRGHGVRILGPDSSGHQILGNSIGASGTTAAGNGGDGVHLGNGVSGSLVSGNTLVDAGFPTALNADSGWGVRIAGPNSRFNRIENNSIGMIVGLATGNRRGGVRLHAGAAQNSVGETSAGNSIGSNGGPGVLIEGEDSDGNSLFHNRIGLVVDGGSIARPNAGSGVLVRDGADDTVIGEGNGSAGDSTRRNWIATNTRDGIEVLGDATDGTLIRSNYIGTEIMGLGAMGNMRNGIYIEDGDAAVIENNLIAANGNDGIKLQGNVAGASIQGNTVGLNRDRDEVLGNGASGIALLGGPTDTLIGNLASNYVGGSGGAGVFINGASTLRATVQGNYLGGTGVMPFGNGGSGIFMGGGTSQHTIRTNIILANGVAGLDLNNADANTIAGNFIGGITAGSVFPNPRGIRLGNGSAGNVIGGPDPGDRNFITAGALYGIALFNPGTDANQVRNNRIGELLGDHPAGVQGPGVLIQEGVRFNTVRDNLIAWSLGPGIWLRNQGASTTQDNVVIGNIIRDGVADGVRISDNASLNRIGGQIPSEANAILRNGGSGIVVQSGTGNHLWDNSLLWNEGMAIDLGDDGPTTNDAGDGDSGANGLQNFPLLGDVMQGTNETRIAFALDSTPQRSFRIELYGFATSCAPGGGGAGVLLDSQNVQTDADGLVEGEFVLPFRISSLASATATDLITLDTSELGSCVGDPDAVFGNGFETL